ncbi:phenazine biosynthesis protein PhzF family [Catenulispora acidiphila DSM 44928]|uniref:Phenazine biosynthesis protein PhzF family n=1 Tax=Catenulispora acidiphila (strain DSM 44928 / JCM 14897 / NBRC 102108 / NRRL B-24433 / ID139908) TaxID=479433 RepID=C7QEK4_CATAD|nr:PhzF family phenazine biosynthesis protein [Catenulispora acidiphila]ACU70895.1 phenazine biosynthesis protein PhzF family [Catenulispora acidiphila DSM 44928]
MQYFHVDVFSSQPYSGNSLAVFPDATALTGSQMAQITRELRHFESIFLLPEGEGADVHRRQARVFDLIEELDFAGHPVLGAACVLHELRGSETPETLPETWSITLPARTVQITTQRRSQGHFSAVLDQGQAEFRETTAPHDVASWFSLDDKDLDPELPPQVVSTGLRYLILPVRPGTLERARIAIPDLDIRLEALGAQFAYLLDAEAMEGRHWNNDGVLEDVATGSAAGCVAAYLRRHDRLGDGETATLHQGRFLDRPSTITLRAHGSGTDISSVEVEADVVFVARGTLDRIPA